MANMDLFADVNTNGVVLFTQLVEMNYTHEEFTKIIEKFREADANDLTVSIGYGLEDNLFHYDKNNKGQEVSFEQKDHYITISKENARDLFDHYEAQIKKPRWTILSDGVIFNNNVYVPNCVIDYMDCVDECLDVESEDLIPEDISALFSLKDGTTYCFSMNRNQITIHAPKNRELKFTRKEWSDFYNDWYLS
mgnify:CR=1 FL=1